MLIRTSASLLLALTLGAGCGAEFDLGNTQQALSVTWTDVQNATVSGDGEGGEGGDGFNDLTKTANDLSWTSGAVSVAEISGDGFVEFSTAEANTRKMAGLSKGNADENFTDIDFAD